MKKMEILHTIDANTEERTFILSNYKGKENVPFATSSQVKLDQIKCSYNAGTPLWKEASLPIPRSTCKAYPSTSSYRFNTRIPTEGMSDVVSVILTPTKEKGKLPFCEADQDEEIDLTIENQRRSMQIFDQHLSQFSHTNDLVDLSVRNTTLDEPLPLPPCGQQITPPTNKAKKQTKRKSRATKRKPERNKPVEKLMKDENTDVSKILRRPKPRKVSKKDDDSSKKEETKAKSKVYPNKTVKIGKKGKEEIDIEPDERFNIPKFLHTDVVTAQAEDEVQDDDTFFFHNVPTVPKVDCNESHFDSHAEDNGTSENITEDSEPTLAINLEEATSTDSILTKTEKAHTSHFDPNHVSPEEKARIQKLLLSLINCPLCREFWPTLSEDKDGKIVNKTRKVCKGASGPKRINHLHMCAKKYEQSYEEVVSLLHRDKISLDRSKRFERIKEIQEEGVWEELCGENVPCTQVQTSVQKMLKSKKNWYKIEKYVREKAKEEQEIQTKKKQKRVRSKANGGTDRETTMIVKPSKLSRSDIEKCFLLFGPSYSLNKNCAENAVCLDGSSDLYYDFDDQACEMPFESVCRARKRRKFDRQGHPDRFDSSANSLSTMGLLFGQRLAKAFKSKSSGDDQMLD